MISSFQIRVDDCEDRAAAGTELEEIAVTLREALFVYYEKLGLLEHDSEIPEIIAEEVVELDTDGRYKGRLTLRVPQLGDLQARNIVFRNK